MGDSVRINVSLDGSATESTGGECPTWRHSGFASVLRIASLQAAEKRVPELTRPELSAMDWTRYVQKNDTAQPLDLVFNQITFGAIRGGEDPWPTSQQSSMTV
jgi:hypothetical protein